MRAPTVSSSCRTGASSTNTRPTTRSGRTRRWTRSWPSSRSTVPTMWLQGLWDQEDMWGAIHSYEATEPKDKNNDKNFLVMGPWRHSQVNYDGTSLGPLQWDGDTALQFRRDVLQAVLRPVPGGRCAEGQHAARADLQHRRKPLGSLQVLAAQLRQGLPQQAEVALPRCRRHLVVQRAGWRCGQVRRVRVRSGQAGAVPAAAGALCRSRRVDALAGERSALRRMAVQT